MGTETVKEPECLKGCGVDWRGYVPPHMAGMGEDFVTARLKPAMEAAKAECEKARRISRENAAKVTEMRRRAAEMSAFAGHAKEFVGEGATAFFKEWASLTRGALAEVECKCAELEKSVLPDAVFASDIAFVTTVEKFFEADLECDLLLFALFRMDMKYRMKAFREVNRKLKEIGECLKVMDGSKSPLRAGIPAEVWRFYEGLRERYLPIMAAFKGLKKRVEKSGVDALSDDATLLEATGKYAKAISMK